MIRGRLSFAFGGAIHSSWKSIFGCITSPMSAKRIWPEMSIAGGCPSNFGEAGWKPKPRSSKVKRLKSVNVFFGLSAFWNEMWRRSTRASAASGAFSMVISTSLRFCSKPLSNSPGFGVKRTEPVTRKKK